jgi:beta-lactam-binding protein with PASTA domain
VPPVEGLSEQEALAALSKAGLNARVVVSDDPDTGLCSKVLNQSPAVNRMVPAGSVVRILVDRGTECPGDEPGGSPDPSATPSP